ncbi:MAG: hypothetical protein NTX85_02470 [Candidatus Nomurabacteria bacterium]|nr:hypothetical protein [Candidatus Nomurabacteria bacterium]
MRKCRFRHLLFSIIITIFSFVFFQFTAHASTDVTDDIYTDTTWTAIDSPYIVHNNLLIDIGATLTLEAGTIVKFDNGAGLYLLGNLDSNGTESEPVYLTSFKDDSVGGDTDGDGGVNTPNYNDWGNIIFDTGSVSGNFNHTLVKYSSGILSFGATVNARYLEDDNSLMIFGVSDNSISHSSLNSLSLFGGSTASLTNSVMVDAAENSYVYLDGSSNLSVYSTTINSNQNVGTIFSVFDHSTLRITDSSITGYGGSFSRALGVFDYSNLHLRNTTITSIAYGVYSDSNANLNIRDSSIDCNRDGLNISRSVLDISGGSIHCTVNGINIFNSESVIDGITVYGATENGIISYDGTSDIKSVSILNSEVKDNHYGISAYQSPVIAHGNSIHSNYVGAFAYDDYVGILDFTKNWWGSPSGPYQVNDNPDGTGDEVLDYISYDPWLRYDPLHPGPSNVLFIPGFQASRLYKQKHFPIIGDVEDKLWEPNTNSDVTDMYMDMNGVSINPDIYTRDIVDTESILGLGNTKIYDSFISDMNALVASGTISDWRAAPYDWRLSPDDIVSRGAIDSNGNISYNNDLGPTDESYMVRQVLSLINTSRDGKVTIVTHSNGGLVAKALMVKLQAMKDAGLNNYIDYIDRVIMVAAPQVGTPKAIPSLLHGYKQDLLNGVFLRQSIARIFGLNLPGGYGLLPSEKYFYTVKDSPVLFDKSLEVMNPYVNLHKTYGDSIGSYSDYISFLLGTKDSRVQPGVDELSTPSILGEGILTRATEMHSSIDNYVFPPSVHVYQVAGWGLPTVKSVRYFARTDCVKLIAGKPCIKVKSVDVEPNLIDDGDKTVVTPSAIYEKNADSYYVNLYQYASDHKININKTFEHADFFELSYLRDFIKNTLLGIDTLPDYFSKVKPKSNSNLVLNVHLSPGVKKTVQVVSKTGTKVGVDNITPISLDADNFEPILSQIPGASFTHLGHSYYFYLPTGSGSSYTLQISSVDTGVSPVVGSVVDVQDVDNIGGTGSQVSEGEVTIRVDTVNDTTIENSVYTPPITVGSGGSASVDISDTGTTGPVAVDTGGSGSIDNTVPFVPTPDPSSPVQIEPDITLQNTPDTSLIIRSSGGHPSSIAALTENIKSEIQNNVESQDLKVVAVTNTESDSSPAPFSGGINNIHIEKSSMGNQEKVSTDSVYTPDTNTKTKGINNNSMLASVYNTLVNVPIDVLLIVILFILLLVYLVYRRRNKVK